MADGMKRDQYTATLRNAITLSSDETDFVRRRTMPFLHTGSHYSLERLMGEACIQGLRDAVEVTLNPGGAAAAREGEMG